MTLLRNVPDLRERIGILIEKIKSAWTIDLINPSHLIWRNKNATAKYIFGPNQKVKV